MTNQTDIAKMTIDLPWGQIMPWAFGIVASISLTILGLTKKLPGFRGKKGTMEIQVGEIKPNENPIVYKGPDRRRNDQVNMRILYLTQVIFQKKIEMTDTIKATQRIVADEMEDAFWPILSGRVSIWHIEAVWVRLWLVLYAIIDQNHILDCCFGDIDPAYLASKMALFKRKYEKLALREPGELPEYSTLELKVREIFIAIIKEFYTIALKNRNQFDTYISSLKMTTDNDEVKEIISKLAKQE